MFKLESSLETAKLTKTALETEISKIDNDMQSLLARKHLLEFDLERLALQLTDFEVSAMDVLQLPAPTANRNGHQNNQEDTHPKKYNKVWKLRQKMQFVIYKAGVPLTSDEIKAALYKHEPELDTTNVSAYLSQGITSNAFIKHLVDSGKPKYALGSYIE